MTNQALLVLEGCVDVKTQAPLGGFNSQIIKMNQKCRKKQNNRQRLLQANGT